MKNSPNLTDHRFALGDKVEYGFLGPHGGDRLGEVAREHREHGQDGYLIRPLSGLPGDGYLPEVYPWRQVVTWTPARWRYEASSHMSGYVRTYAEIISEAVRRLTVPAPGGGFQPPVIGYWDRSGKTRCLGCPPPPELADAEIYADNSAADGEACEFCRTSLGADALARFRKLGEGS